MSLYSVMRTSVSGMAAQSNRLATVADNVANVNTTGYKRAYSEFSSLLLSICPGDYSSGAVLTSVRHAIGQQGALMNTSSVTDLAVSGNGFFIVADKTGTPYLTRAGSFVPDGQGNLLNAAGFQLMGYPLTGGSPTITVNGYKGLQPVTLADLALSANPTTSGQFVANLPSDATVVAAADLPSANAATASYTAKSSLVTYDNLGKEVLLDVYYTKTATGTWEVAVFDKSTAASGGGFPYSSGPLSTQTLTFDPSNGKLDSASATSINIPIPGGSTLALDLSKMTQLATSYNVISAKVDGNAPSGAELVEIAKDGTMYATYQDGTRVAVYRIPLAHVQSPDNLQALPGNVFQTTSDSGDVQVGLPQTGPLGSIFSGSLEQSTVDLATELTTMIDSQRSYSANSKVFQTGSELMDVLVNLKR
jgi:flagellar hook protein FlgE